MSSCNVRVIALNFALLGCNAAMPQSIKYGPFADVDLGKLSNSQRGVIAEASEDFELVKLGKSPIHAKVDQAMAVPADGGTSFYVGNHYRLTIVKSLSSFGPLTGYVYGPVLAFDKSFATGNMQTVSSTRFLTPAQLSALGSK